MISILTGTLVSLITNLIIIGFYFIEAGILAVTFNKMAPIISEKFDLILPIDYVSIWFVWGIFILVHFIGRLINIVIPKIINIENNK